MECQKIHAPSNINDMITECNICGNKERHPMAWGHNCSSTKDCSGTQQMLNETEECGHCKGECIMDQLPQPYISIVTEPRNGRILLQKKARKVK